MPDSQEEQKKNACEKHSCHPLTECQAIKTKEQGTEKWSYKPVCMRVPSCSTKKCMQGEKCSMKEVKCQLTPCFKIPTCLPDVNEASPEYQMPPAFLV
ncbi:Protein CBG27177 [Caenorhabditis briggsae]|uniref:Uncharacterized protein n=2 Tax=Caenorhabditis briggsae TaxID=6238 RepID=A0AAE9JNW8_CAEBR|nr:Protein CBG27177 [Caenorhabditis briggsae]ULT90622.1 hypothetical protein L3Y34_008739 [Caenorhabditis briggsae]UMM36405.1 hypothetical protein L5515_008579 [Caenorhabditis briggsae]CAS00640.1 Protein CBG27177 [Caenorhabditis briggsae]